MSLPLATPSQNDFPTHDPVQSNLRGVSDLFLVRLQVSGLALSFSDVPLAARVTIQAGGWQSTNKVRQS